MISGLDMEIVFRLMFVKIIVPDDKKGATICRGDKCNIHELIRTTPVWKIRKKGGIPRKHIVVSRELVLEKQKLLLQITSESENGERGEMDTVWVTEKKNVKQMTKSASILSFTIRWADIQ